MMMNNEDDESISKQIFSSLDRKEDKVITADELKYAFYCLGEILTDDEVRHLIQFASNNKDSVSYDEFFKLYKRS